MANPGAAIRRFFFGLFCVIAIAGMAGTKVHAQGAASLLKERSQVTEAVKSPAVTPLAELETLARTLENDETRAKFLATLKGLIALRKAEAEKVAVAGAAEGLAARIAGKVSGSVQALGNRLTAVAGILRDVPQLVPLAQSWVTDADKRDRLIGGIWRFIVIVGLGMAVQFAFRKAATKWRSRLEHDSGTEVGGRIIRFAARTFLLFANALAYGVGAYGAYVVLPMAGPAGEVLLVGASSFFVAKLILAATRMVVSPGVPLLRPVPVSDETAHYIYIWIRRLVRIFVYAFFAIAAMHVVGLPGPAHESLLYLVGFAFAAFLAVFVLQNRTSVAAAIKGPAAVDVYGGLRDRLAATWHMFAILYIAAVYLVWLFQVEGGFEFLMTATAWTVMTVIVAKLLVIGAAKGVGRLFDVSADLDTRFPGLEARANRYVPLFNRIIAGLIYFAAALVVLDAWSVDTLEWLASEEGALMLRKSVTVGLILLVGLVVWEAINLAIARYLDRMDDDAKGAARARTLLPLMRTTALIVLVVTVSLAVLSEIGVNIGPLLAGAGVIGLAIGFGSQKMVQDVITGLFILIEDTLSVGDVVRFDADHSGTVEALSIRSVRLRDLSGNVHTLPFSEVKTILNMTKDWSFYVFEIGIAYRENVDHVMDVLREIGADLESDPDFAPLIMEPLEVMGLDKFGDSAIIIKARMKVQPPGKQWLVGREFNRRMKARFDAEGIEIPFPHQTIYFGEDREGLAPAAHVKIGEPGSPSQTAPGTASKSGGRSTKRRSTASGDNLESGDGDE